MHDWNMLPTERLDDLQVYKRLLILHTELDEISKRTWSLSAATAIATAALLIRTLASGLYDSALRSFATDDESSNRS
jgi:hypothetical protein